MISIRYVLLAVGGMFLALAVGVALGAGPLQGDSEQQWRAEVNQLDDERTTLQRELAELRTSRDHGDEFVSAVEAGLIADTLTDQNVAIVVLPGAEDTYADAFRTTLESAGATVTGRVTIEPRWTEPGQQQLLEDTSSRLVTDDTELPADGGAYDRAAAVLARALVTNQPEVAGKPDNDTTAILAGYAAAELVSADDELARAELAVVVAPPTTAESAGGADAADDEVAARNAAWMALLGALDRGGNGVVVAGDSTAAGVDGLVDAVRVEAKVRDAVSSVDGLELSDGKVASEGPVGVVYALAEQLAGEVGHYGRGDGADGIVAPVPTPAGSNPDAARQSVG